MKMIFFSIYLFFRRVWGCINSPYQTYRHISQSSILPLDVFIIWLCIGAYSLWAPVVRIGVRHPSLLTYHAQSLFFSIVAGYLLMVGILWGVGRMVGGKGTIVRILCLWTYTMIPTLIWFFCTSVLYLLIPPPRTTSVYGTVFILLFLMGSFGLLAWKIILVYLTMRFGLLLDMKRILKVGVVMTGALLFYAVWVYNLGITRIPFL